MTTHVRCGSLFTGDRTAASTGGTLVYGDNGLLTYVGPTEGAPVVAVGETVLNYESLFVMPGLIDVHVHLAYGNA